MGVCLFTWLLKFLILREWSTSNLWIIKDLLKYTEHDDFQLNESTNLYYLASIYK